MGLGNLGSFGADSRRGAAHTSRPCQSHHAVAEAPPPRPPRPPPPFWNESGRTPHAATFLKSEIQNTGNMLGIGVFQPSRMPCPASAGLFFEGRGGRAAVSRQVHPALFYDAQLDIGAMD